MSKAKKGGKTDDTQQTPFRPVPYETTDIRTSITLLTCVEIDIVIRALSTLSKYADEKDLNVIYLYRNGIVTKLITLLAYSNAPVLRFTLKLLAQIVALVPDAALELSFQQYNNNVKQVAHLFMTTTDTIVKEFSVQFLANVVQSKVLASSMLKMGVLVSIFEVFTSSQDADTQYNALVLFERLLEAREAVSVIPSVPEFSLRLILCYKNHNIQEIQTESFNIIEKLASWNSPRMQALFQEEKVVEQLFNLVLNEDYKLFHKICLNIILICMKFPETANYFVESLEFIKFTQWTKTCEKKFMLPAITILVNLTKEPKIRQLLFDFSVEDCILSFFRTENEIIFVKVCEGICNMSTHMYCCNKIVTPVVIKCVLQMLTRDNVKVVPYHETAINTLLTLLKRNEKTVTYVVECDGIAPLQKAIKRNKEQYTYESGYNIFYIFFILASNVQYKLAAMDKDIYQMLLDIFEENQEYSNMAVLILDQYTNDQEYRQHFLEYNGSFKIITLLLSTPSEELFKNTLLFLERILVYKKLCMMFLWQGGFRVLEKNCKRLCKKIPLIQRIIALIYKLFLPLKFFKLGRLEITDHLDSQFYITDPICPDFPYLELMQMMSVCSRRVVYVVDFSADVTQLTKKEVPNNDNMEKKSSSLMSQKSSLKKNSKNSSSIKRNSSEQFNTSDNSKEHVEQPFFYSVPPPINYGYLSEDPYLPQYLAKARTLIYENDSHIYCFEHQIKALAKFVDDVLSGPPYPGSQASRERFFKVHIEALKETLGTTLIPIGYVRYGFHREKSLLFKALSDKLGIPATLVRGTLEGTNNFIYWNEVPVTCSVESNSIDNFKTYMGYGVVDLMEHIGTIMMVGTIEANKYCGIPLPGESTKVQVLTLRNILGLSN